MKKPNKNSLITKFTKTATLVVAIALGTVQLQKLWAATAPSLGLAGSIFAPNFSVLGAETVTNTGPTIVVGNLGVSPGTAVTGFPPGTVTGGVIHAADAAAANAKAQALIAYTDLQSRACTMSLTGQDLGGLTLKPGVYCFSSSAQLTGTVTLDGNASSVFIFKIGSTLTTASASSVVLKNGARDCRVFWQIGSSATLGTRTRFAGNIIALTSITLTTGAEVFGKALALNGAVTLDSNNVSPGTCSGSDRVPCKKEVKKCAMPKKDCKHGHR